MCRSVYSLLAVLLLVSTTARALPPAGAYAVASIPETLFRSASMIKRTDETIIQVQSPAKATVYRKYAYTILDEAGQAYAAFADYYNQFRQIRSITGTLYDKDGNKLRQVKKKDIQDGAMDDQMSLMTDTRYKYHNFFYSNYPYTVEYEEEIEMNGILNLPGWQVLPRQHMALQNGRLEIQVPENYALRYKQLNLAITPQVETTAKGKKYSWQLKDMSAMQDEPFSPDWEELAPAILLAPTDFEIDGHKGTMDSWLVFGQFMRQLYNNKDVLPAVVREKVQQLTGGLTSTREKIKRLYEFMQQETRYISIQLGIGGWQPFDAGFVATKKYGDCKALSNYMCALLKEAGIKGYPVLIYGGNEDNKVQADFPSNQFNHAIACVPDGKDSIWLECTSQTVAAGFMGSFTGNRYALLVAEDGGHLVRTPQYASADNIQSRKVEAVIDESGNLRADVHTHFTGQQQELQHHLIHDANKEERDKYLNTRLNLPTYTVSASSYREVKNTIPEVYEYLQLESPGYATVSGRRLFVQPNIFNKSGTQLSADTARRFDIEFRMSYRDVDTVLLQVPAGYTTEALPASVNINNAFGSYSIRYRVSGTTIEMIRTREMKAQRFPPDQYTALVSMYAAIYKADRGRVVLVKKE